MDRLFRGRLAIIFAMLVAAAVVFWPASQALAALWSDTRAHSYTHGYLILGLSLWLIFERRGELAAAPIEARPARLALLPILTALWVVCWKAGLQDLQLALLPPIVLATLFALLGAPSAKLLAFPIGFLYFAFPLWGQVNGLLQALTVKAVDVLIWLTGLPAVVYGNDVRVPAGVFEIAEGCSGLHYMIVSLAMAALHGELHRHSLRWRVRWLLLMGTMALVANWARVFVIVVAGYLTDMKTFLVTVDHYWFGWALYAFSLAGCFWIARRFGPEAPAHRQGDKRTRHHGVSARACVATVASMMALPALAYSAEFARAEAVTAAVAWPVSSDRWQPSEAEQSSWRPEFHGAGAIGRRTYHDVRGGSVEFFSAVYARQEQGTELVAYDNSVLGSAETYQLLDERDVPASAGTWRESHVGGPRGEAIVWWQYRIGSRVFVTPLASQLWYGMSSIFSTPRSSLVALRAPCTSGCDAARADLQDFVATLPHNRKVASEGMTP